MHDLAKRVLASREKILGKKSVDTLNTTSNVAWALDRLGRYEEALDLYGEVRSSRTEVLGNHHPDTLMTTYNMALALENLGRYEAMLQLLEQVLVSQEEIFGKEHQDTLTTTHQKSQALGHLGRHEEALGLYQEVFASRKKILGDEHPDTLKTSHNIAQTFNYLKKYELALALYEQILASRRIVLGGEHPDTLDTAHNFAHTLTNLSRYKESVEIYARVLATREKALGQEHPSSLETAHNMAQALSHLRRYQEALGLYTSVVSSRKKVLGTEHSDTLSTIYGMAWALYCIGTYEEALVLYQQVLSSRKEILGKEHPDTMETTSKVAQTLNCLGRYEEALELYEGVLPNRDEALEDPATLATAHNIAKILAHLGRHIEAADLYERVLPGRREVLGSEDLDTLGTCQGMAYTLGCLGRYEESLGLYGEVLESQENRLREGHPDVLRTVKCMASIQEKAGWLKGAKSLYEEVLVGQKRELGEKHPDTLDTIRRLGIVVDYLGCDDETIIETSSETAAALEGLRGLGKASEFCPLAITQNTAARSDPQILRNEDFRLLQQSLVTQDKRPGKGSFGVLKLIGETIPSPEELGRQSEASDPDERTLHSLNKLPGNKDQSISGITSFLKRHIRRLEETTWRIKYKISSLEFSIIRELESSRINRELPTRVQWKCTCGGSLFDDFQELSGGSPAAQFVSRLYRGSSNVEIDGSEPILGLPDFFSFPTSMFLGAHYPLNLSLLIQIFLGGSGLLGFPLSLVQIVWRDIGLVGFLNRLGGVVSHPSYPTQGGTSNQNSPSPAQPIQTASNSQQPSQGTANNPYLPPQVGPSHQVRNRSSPTQVTPTPSSTDHLFLCFNDEFVYFRNLQLAPNISDQEIFMAIREEYYRRRGWWRSQFSFEVLKRVDFVKFEIYYQNHVEIRVRGDLPPVDNKEYKYLPKPAEMIPPVPGFMYFFHKPECATPNSDELLTRMPKKICALRGRGYGWGIHFIEEPCMFRVYMLAVFIVIIDSVFAVVWSVVKKDIQGGFGIAAFITSVGAIFIAIGWRQTENGKGY